MKKYYLYFFICCFFPSIWIYFRILNISLPTEIVVFLSGISILCAAFLLTWSAEAAEKDVSRTLALSFLALIAVLPEYAVDIYFAWTAGKNHSYISYATANMTGGNRLLIGIGWAGVVLLACFKKRRKNINVPGVSLEVYFLTLATVYSFLIPLKKTLSLFDSLILIFLYIFYILQASRLKPVQEVEVVGPPELIINLNKAKRIVIIIFLFFYSGVVIFLSAEPFAESLLKIGRIFKIEEFILVQWIAPLASEAPEIIASIIFVMKLKESYALGTLISSKINQWTLLVGMLPLAFIISGAKIIPMHLDSRQIEEILLTSTQSIFAVAILSDLSISVYEAIIIFILFITQLIFPSQSFRYFYSFLYLILTFFILSKNKFSNFKKLLKLQKEEADDKPGSV